MFVNMCEKNSTHSMISIKYSLVILLNNIVARSMYIFEKTDVKIFRLRNSKVLFMRRILRPLDAGSITSLGNIESNNY